jgi:hypothetical protein
LCSWIASSSRPTLDDVLAAMADDEARALLAVLEPIAQRKRRQAEPN